MEQAPAISFQDEFKLTTMGALQNMTLQLRDEFKENRQDSTVSVTNEEWGLC